MPLLGEPCPDDAFPALVGRVAVGCEGGAARILLDLLTRKREIIREKPPQLPVLGPGILWEENKGIWRFSEELALAYTAPLWSKPALARTTDGQHGALAWEDRLEVFKWDDPVRRAIEGHPLPGQPIALAWPMIAWVESVAGNLELFWGDAISLKTGLLSGGPGMQHRPVASGHYLGWVEPDAVVVMNTHTQEKNYYPAQTGFLHAPSLWGPVACWEERHQDIDIRCSDGMEVRLPGDQLAPWRSGPHLLYQQSGQARPAVLYTSAQQGPLLLSPP